MTLAYSDQRNNLCQKLTRKLWQIHKITFHDPEADELMKEAYDILDQLHGRINDHERASDIVW